MKKLVLVFLAVLFSFNIGYSQVKHNVDKFISEDEYEKWKSENKNFSGNLKIEHNDSTFEIVPFTEGVINGTVKKYYNRKSLESEITYDNGKLVGVQTVYYKSGSVKSVYPIKNQNINGLGEEFYENGVKKAQTKYKNGKKHGLEILYYTNGNKGSEIHYKNDVKNGDYKHYFSNGALKSTGKYKKDKINGKTSIYYENGKLFSYVIYVDGKAVEGICADTRVWTEAELSNWNSGIEVSCNNNDDAFYFKK